MNFSKELQVLDNTLLTYFISKRTEDELTMLFDPMVDRVGIEYIKWDLNRLGLLLAGGAINSIFTGRPVKDLDFYMTDRSMKHEAIRVFSRYFGRPEFLSDNAITWKRKAHGSRRVFQVQLITRFTGTPREIFEWFDFTIVQDAYDFIYNEFSFGDRFFQDIAARKLVFCGKSKFPICAMYRTKKYIARGYNCPGSTIMHIALSIVRLEIKTYKDLKEQLMGIDTQYLIDLLSQEKYNEALPVDYGQFLADAFTRIDGFSREDLREEEENE